jgi:hypothetical protein
VSNDDTLYLLHDNGNVWRYYDDGRPETEDLKLIDPGVGTAQIFVAGSYLYLLKSDGAIWRISNPRNPTLENDLAEITAPLQDVTIQEMFISTPAADDGDAQGSLNLYLLTAQRLLLEGNDANDARVTFAPIAVPPTAQTTVSQ